LRLAYPLTKAKIELALCDVRLAEEMEEARALASDLSPSGRGEELPPAHRNTL
jgi:hypothetical protein